MAEAISTPSSRWGSTAQLEQLWHDLADDPVRQAVECAELCLSAAPHLVEWLEHRIMANMPDALLTELALYTPADGRIQALSRLAEFRYNRIEKPAAPLVERTEPRRVLPSRGIDVTPANVEEVFERLFGVKPQIVEAPRLIKVDWELARIAVKLEEAAEFRLWAIGRDLTSHQQGSGVITKAELWQRLKVYGIQYSTRHFNRLLKAGTGMYWQIAGENLYLTGYFRLSMVLDERVGEDEIVGNLPGVWPVLLNPAGGLEQWESTIYAGWVAGRGWKRAVTISRQMQSVLFGRSENTIRKWEADHLEGVVNKRSNIAQCPDEDRYRDHIPLHAQPYAARAWFNRELVEVARFYWQLPNTYFSEIQPHTRRGMARKVRRAFTKEYPAEYKRGGQCLRYVPSPDDLKRRHKSIKFRTGEYGPTSKPLFVYLGDHRRSQRGIFEINNSGFLGSRVNERLKPQAEAEYFATHPPTQEQQALAYWLLETGDKTAKLGHFLRGQ